MGNGADDLLTERIKTAQAKDKGYEGDACPSCGEFMLVKDGALVKCEHCGDVFTLDRQLYEPLRQKQPSPSEDTLGVPLHPEDGC